MNLVRGSHRVHTRLPGWVHEPEPSPPASRALLQPDSPSDPGLTPAPFAERPADAPHLHGPKDRQVTYDPGELRPRRQLAVGAWWRHLVEEPWRWTAGAGVRARKL